MLIFFLVVYHSLMAVDDLRQDVIQNYETRIGEWQEALWRMEWAVDENFKRDEQAVLDLR